MRAKTAQKSSKQAKPKQVQVWQCIKCGKRWDDHQLERRLFGLDGLFDAFNSINNSLTGGSSEGLPPGRICDMGGECVWRRIK